MIAILGTGKMGEALLSGLLRAGRPPSAVVAAVRREDRGAELHARYGIEVTDAASAAKLADTLVLAVKPQDMGRLLDEIAPAVPPGRLVISVAAGITTAFIERRLAGEVPVVRVMSNTPVLVDEAMSVVSAGRPPARSTCAGPRNCSARSARCCAYPNRSRTRPPRCPAAARPTCTTWSSRWWTPRILLGMARGAALEMVTQAVYGAATMLRESGEHPVILREAVTSPGGTTISAISGARAARGAGRVPGRHRGGPRPRPGARRRS